MADAPGDLLASSWEGSLRRYDHRALGTWNALFLADPDPASQETTDRAARSAFDLLDRLEEELSRFRPESDVTRLNSAGQEGPVRVGRSLSEILRRSKEAWVETGGAFDPTVGGLMDAWGFPRGPARVPRDDEIQSLLDRRGMEHVQIDESAGSAWFDRPGISLDLGAVGKGYAADRVKAHLQSRGIKAGAIVFGRSTIHVWGSPPGEDAWRVSVAHPREPGDAIAILRVKEGSISTSSLTEASFQENGIEYGHILDPRTGKPARTPLRSVTVWTDQAIDGDILSTALFVLGKKEGEALLQKVKRASALLIEEDPTCWGGLRVVAIHAGDPGFQLEARS